MLNSRHLCTTTAGVLPERTRGSACSARAWIHTWVGLTRYTTVMRNQLDTGSGLSSVTIHGGGGGGGGRGKKKKKGPLEAFCRTLTKADHFQAEEAGPSAWLAEQAEQAARRAALIDWLVYWLITYSAND